MTDLTVSIEATRPGKEGLDGKRRCRPSPAGETERGRTTK
jgi:hypothetical protein